MDFGNPLKDLYNLLKVFRNLFSNFCILLKNPRRRVTDSAKSSRTVKDPSLDLRNPLQVFYNKVFKDLNYLL